MNYRMILRIIALVLFIEAGLLVPGTLISLSLGEHAALIGFLKTLGIIAAVSIVLYLLTRRIRVTRFQAREGLVVTGLVWIFMSMLGALPFYFSGEIPSYIDAFFETVSGFTTTGSSILTEVESMSKGLLFWRSFTHWIGGMGVLVFLMAIVSLGGKNQGFTLHILRAESPGPAVGKMVPRMKKTAAILYWIYVGLTVLNVIFLLLGRLSLFDALCTAFGTAGTGGFGVYNDSCASFSPYVQIVTTVFMFLFSMNFSIYYLLLLGKVKEALMDQELHLFWGIAITATVLLVWNVHSLYATMGEAIRHVCFTVGTLMSTTGYGTTDFDLWPSFSKAIVLFLMIGGACAGSTGGGMKMVRFMLLWKNLRRNIHKSLHPTEVKTVQVNGRPIDEGILDNTMAYLVAYVLIILFSILVISLDGFSVETNISAVLATFNNIGPGLDTVGPTCNFSMYSDLSKLVMIVDMLAGRLEIFPILILFSGSTWKKAR